MKIKRLLSFILAVALILSCCPVIPSGIHAVTEGLPQSSAVDYTVGYTWSFDSGTDYTFTKNDKGLFDNSATYIDTSKATVDTDATIALMNHEMFAGSNLSRTLKNGVLSTRVVKDFTWTATPVIGLYYRLPAGLETGKTYTVNMELFSGEESAVLKGNFTVSFEDLPTNTYGGNLQEWNQCTHRATTMELVPSTKELEKDSGIVSFNITPNADVAAGKWMLISVPIQTTVGSYNLGNVTMKEANYADGFTWAFDEEINAFTTDNKFKVMQYGNNAKTVGIVSHSAYGNYGSRSLKNGILTTKITSSWATGASGVYYKLPAGLVAGQEYVVSMNLYASTAGQALINSYSTSIKLSFSNGIPTKVTDEVDQYWTAKHIEGIHNAATMVTYRAPDYLSADTANELKVSFVATQTMADNDAWMLISFPLTVNAEVNLGSVTMAEKKDTSNHLLNGDFSDGLTGWMTNFDSSYLSVRNGVLDVTAKVPTGDVKLYQSMYLEAGTYRLSFDVLGNPTSWRPVYFMGTALDNSSVTGAQLRVDQESGKSESGWWKVTRDVTISTAGTYYFQMNLNQVSNSASVAPAMQYDNFELRKLLSVTTNADNATFDNSDTTVVERSSYENTVTAKEGYLISKVTVTMGGEEVTGAYDASTGKISVPVVTGNLTVTVETTQKTYAVTVLGEDVQASHNDPAIHGATYSVELTTATAGKKVNVVAVKENGADKAFTFASNVLTVENVTGLLEITTQLESIALSVALENLSGISEITLDPLTDVIYGLPYEGTLTVPEAQKQFLNVQVTMSGAEVTNAYDASNGKISIPEVTGAIIVKVTYTGSCEIRQNCGNATSSNTVAVIPDGGNFEATYTANSGYKIIDLTYTVDGVAGDPSHVTIATDRLSASINLTNVMGDVVQITVTTQANVYQVVTNGEHVTNNNTTATHDSGYSATLTPESNYAIKSVTVTMDGQEVPGAYSNGTVTIAKVTGEIVITVETVAVDTDNLLWNGDFTLGEEGWDRNSNATADKGILEIVNGELKYNHPATLPGGDVKISQELTLEPGKYIMSFDSKGQPTANRPVFYISKDNVWSPVGKTQHTVSAAVTDPDGWTHISQTVEITEAGTYHFVLCVANQQDVNNPVDPMYFDNFAVRKCFDVSVVNPQGGAVAGVKDFTVPHAVLNQPFELVLEPLDATYDMTVSYIMGGGTEVQVTPEADGSAKIRISKVTGDVKIIVNAWKSSYSVVTNGAVTNSNSAQTVANGSSYQAVIKAANSNKKLYAVTCMMGNTQIPVQVVNGEATINIPQVSGNIVIHAVVMDQSIIAQWIFDINKVVTGNGDWGDSSQTISVAGSTYNDGNSAGKIDRVVKPNELTISTHLTEATFSWADPGSVLGFKLPADLVVGKSYMLTIPLWAGNNSSSLVSSKPGSDKSGIDLFFTTVRPYNMWAEADFKGLTADNKGVLAASVPSIGKLTTDENGLFCISFTLTEEMAAFAKAENWLAVGLKLQHVDGVYHVGNVTLNEVTEPVKVTTDLGNASSNGAVFAQSGNPYFAQISPEVGYKLMGVTVSMGGVDISASVYADGYINIPEVTGEIVIKAVTKQIEEGNLLLNGTFIMGDDFWTFGDGHFSLVYSGGSDALNEPTYIQSSGVSGALLSQIFKVEKNQNYELIFRYKGKTPADSSLWAIGSQNSLAWNSVLYKGEVAETEEWKEVSIVFNSGNYTSLYLMFRSDALSDYCLDNVWIKETNKSATVDRYQRPVLGNKPRPSPYNDYPYICDPEHNLLPDFGFESQEHVLQNNYGKVEQDSNAFGGQNSLHYSTVINAGNVLQNGDLSNADAAQKTIAGWTLFKDGFLDNISIVDMGGEHGNVVKITADAVSGEITLIQDVYLEAGNTYRFAYDFYNKADWGTTCFIGHVNGTVLKPDSDSLNAGTNGAAGEWTTMSGTFRAETTGTYKFAVRLRNNEYPGREMCFDNFVLELVSRDGNPRVEYALKDLKPNTTYWLTAFVKAPQIETFTDRYLTFGINDPETGDFIVTADPSSESGRLYTVREQLIPMAYDDQWHLITVPFNTGDATWLNFSIEGINSEAWFDNIYIFEEQYAETYVPAVTDKDEATVTDEDPDKLGVAADKNLLGNFDLTKGDAFWGDKAHKYGVFGNALRVVDSGSSAYGKALHYVAGKRVTNNYYIKWIDVEPNTEYTFSATYAIVEKGNGFIGLINGYRMDSEITENRVFPTMITQFSFGRDAYLEDHSWQDIAVSFNTGERNRIGIVVCDAGGEAYIDNLRLFKTSDGTDVEEITDTFPSQLRPNTTAVTVTDETVSGVKPETTLEDLLKNFENSQYIRVFDANDNEITDPKAVLGTGAEIRLQDGPLIKDRATIVIPGDVTGDGKQDQTDTDAVISHLSGKKLLEGVYLTAADADGDASMTIYDAMLRTEAPKQGSASFVAEGPSAFAQKDQIEIVLMADVADLKGISGKLTHTDGLKFLSASGDLDGWELSYKKNGNDVTFAYAGLNGAVSQKGKAVITFTFEVQMIQTYDEAKLEITELLATTGTDLLKAEKVSWVRQSQSSGGNEGGNSGGNAGGDNDDPILVAARNRLKVFELKGITISPAFDPEIKEYTATVPFEVDKVEVIAIAADEDATVNIGDTNLEYVGKNTVAVQVVSADGLKRTYKVVITREAPVDEPEPSVPDTQPTEPSEPSVPTEPQKPAGLNAGHIILICLGGAFLCAAAIFVILFLRKKKKDTDKQ